MSPVAFEKVIQTRIVRFKTCLLQCNHRLTSFEFTLHAIFFLSLYFCRFLVVLRFILLSFCTCAMPLLPLPRERSRSSARVVRQYEIIFHPYSHHQLKFDTIATQNSINLTRLLTTTTTIRTE